MAIATDSFLDRAVARPASASPLAGLLRTWRLWRKRSIERHQLAAMNHRELRDLGMSECDVYQEMSKPFWRA